MVVNLEDAGCEGDDARGRRCVLWETKVRRKVNPWEHSLIHGRAKGAPNLTGKLNEDWSDTVHAFLSLSVACGETIGLGPAIYIRPFPVRIIGHLDVGTQAHGHV